MRSKERKVKRKMVKSAKARRKKLVKKAVKRANSHKHAVHKPKVVIKLEEKPQVNQKGIVDGLLGDSIITNYLIKNVSKRTPEIMRMLEKPQDDEKIAEALGMKINAVRRVLNILQGYGITDYKISKNENGWLQFEWSINTREVSKFLDYVEETINKNSVIRTDCNDYFICNDCYADNKLVFTFDAAFEEKFKCGCGKGMVRIDKTEAQKLVEESSRSRIESKELSLF
jgi:transcription initiation factor IIE alpha subunit